jgi:undecaprenyl phosphate-alpha-L-ara4FN deformylase
MEPLRLRVDVCTYRGLRDGVPGIIEVLRRAGARATFFVAMGPDSSGLALPKLLRPSFAWKMLRTGAARTYGLATAFYGTLLPAPAVGAGLPDLLRRIRDEGHEVGAHGWDHRRWQDGLPRFPRERLRAEFGRMAAAYRDALGVDLPAFASPAWMVTADLLDAEEEAGIRYAADARGSSPFLPVFEGREGRVPQLPVTLPTLDERLDAIGPHEFVEEIVRGIGGQPGYSCYTAHAEAEGREHRGLLEEILRRVGRPAAPLGETPLDGLLRRPMGMAPIEGRPYPVCREVPI